VTVEHFRRFIAYYLKEGYIFISPGDILKGLKNDKKYALITFDVGISRFFQRKICFYRQSYG